MKVQKLINLLNEAPKEADIIIQTQDGRHPLFADIDTSLTREGNIFILQPLKVAYTAEASLEQS